MRRICSERLQYLSHCSLPGFNPVFENASGEADFSGRPAQVATNLVSLSLAGDAHVDWNPGDSGDGSS
jgi:hypothetical protein